MKNCPVDGTTCDCGMNYCAVAQRCLVAAQGERLYGHSQDATQESVPAAPISRADLLTQINESSILLSLLYDLDLMPEQLIDNSPLWKTIAIIKAHLVEAERATAQRCEELCKREQGKYSRGNGNVASAASYAALNYAIESIRAAYLRHF